jgi:hypothetical protein
MRTTQSDVTRWLSDGVAKGAAHMIVVCDTFSYEDYPVYVMPNETLGDMRSKYSVSMQRVMEVYDLMRPK